MYIEYSNYLATGQICSQSYAYLNIARTVFRIRIRIHSIHFGTWIQIEESQVPGSGRNIHCISEIGRNKKYSHLIFF
jgi:hypothetical protein